MHPRDWPGEVRFLVAFTAGMAALWLVVADVGAILEAATETKPLPKWGHDVGGALGAAVGDGIVVIAAWVVGVAVLLVVGVVRQSREARPAPGPARLVCPRCRAAVPDGAASCPHCGYRPAATRPTAPRGWPAPARPPSGRMNPDAKRLWVITLIVAVVVVVGLFACCVVLVFSAELRLSPST